VCDRYQFYYSRVKHQEEALAALTKTHETTLRRVEDLKALNHLGDDEVSYLLVALDMIKGCRSALKWSYPFQVGIRMCMDVYAYVYEAYTHKLMHTRLFISVF
jgi:hypothetical protein